MSASSGCPPTEISCDPNAPLHAVFLPPTPAGLLDIVKVSTGCAVVLLLLVVIYLLITRQSRVPFWRRRVAMIASVLAIISGITALWAWVGYLPFTRVNLTVNASYLEWLTRIGPVGMDDLNTLLNSLTCVTGCIVLGSLLTLVIVVEQMLRRSVWHNEE